MAFGGKAVHRAGLAGPQQVPYSQRKANARYKRNGSWIPESKPRTGIHQPRWYNNPGIHIQSSPPTPPFSMPTDRQQVVKQRIRVREAASAAWDLIPLCSINGGRSHRAAPNCLSVFTSWAPITQGRQRKSFQGRIVLDSPLAVFLSEHRVSCCTGLQTKSPTATCCL